MAQVTSAMVKVLRERTGLGVMDCKHALTDAGGDVDLAIEQLRKASKLKAAGRASRTAAEGMLAVQSSPDTRLSVMVEVNTETDFVARNDHFIRFVKKVATVAYEQKAEDVQSLVDAGLEEERQALVQEIGENIQIRRVTLMSSPDGITANYVHTNDRIGVLVALTGGSAELGKDIAMHVAATKPLVVTTADVPTALIENERSIYAAQAKSSGKPEHIMEKMVEGKVQKFLNENSLVEQAFIKDPDRKIGQLLKEANARVLSFVRFEVGEGIEVGKQDFASEVAAARG